MYTSEALSLGKPFGMEFANLLLLPWRKSMRIGRLGWLPVLALFLGGSSYASDLSPDWNSLIRQLGADRYESREKASAELRKQGMKALPHLKKTLLNSPDEEVRARARAVIDAIYGDRREALRHPWMRMEPAPDLLEIRVGEPTLNLEEDELWSLRIGATQQGRPVLFFEAQTYGDPNRLKMLEYLVDAGSKEYECLAGMEPAEWRLFEEAFLKHGDTILLRWRDPEGKLLTRPLRDVLGWAKPRLLQEGLSIGGNHDETLNRALPPEGIPIQIGVVLFGKP